MVSQSVSRFIDCYGILYRYGQRMTKHLQFAHFSHMKTGFYIDSTIIQIRDPFTWNKKCCMYVQIVSYWYLTTCTYRCKSIKKLLGDIMINRCMGHIMANPSLMWPPKKYVRHIKKSMVSIGTKPRSSLLVQEMVSEKKIKDEFKWVWM